MSDGLGVLYYTEKHVKKIHEGHNKLVTVLNEQHIEEKESLVQALRQVVACFKSRAESSTCIEDHHPSCLAFIESKLKGVNKDAWFS